MFISLKWISIVVRNLIHSLIIQIFTNWVFSISLRLAEKYLPSIIVYYLRPNFWNDDDPFDLFFYFIADICRVCRSEATPDKPLFHPCICTGSIKFIHQEWWAFSRSCLLCSFSNNLNNVSHLLLTSLLQWLRYSEKEFCELCNHRFSFIPSMFTSTRFMFLTRNL